MGQVRYIDRDLPHSRTKVWNQARPATIISPLPSGLCRKLAPSRTWTSEMTFLHAGGSYALFAGKECARALGKMTMDAKDCSGSVDDLTEGQMKTLHDWEEKFRSKYPEVGKVGPLGLLLAS